MNLYHKKQRWKIILVLVAIVLVVFSLWFSNNVVTKVKEKEKDRVSQWADAIRRKADLVNLTNSAFHQIRENESKNVQLWALSMGEVNKDLEDYSYVLEMLKYSSSGALPMIITNLDGKIENTHNLEYFDSLFYKEFGGYNRSKKWLDSMVRVKVNDTLNYCIREWPKTHQPIELDLFRGDKQTVYYYDSKKLSDLSENKDSLFNAFTDELVKNKDLVPVLFIDKLSRDLIASNMDGISDSISKSDLNIKIKKLAALNDSIQINLGADRKGVIYFEHSEELLILKYFPIVQFVIIGLFILIGYLVFSTFRKAEQDQVWVGMAKETAHQLGTPISSLMAWIQLLEAQGIEDSTITEMNKDIERLNTVTNRFSKIGSKAILDEENIVSIIADTVDYLKLRISSKIELGFYAEQPEILTSVNKSLMEWVVENIVKNAVDAMEGKGKITVNLKQIGNEIVLDITDTGKGIAPGKLKTVFQPGFTTKARGWGLGLSLVKRIVEEFHQGKITVHKSELNIGTTFRVVLNAK